MKIRPEFQVSDIKSNGFIEGDKDGDATCDSKFVGELTDRSVDLLEFFVGLTLEFVVVVLLSEGT